MAWGHACQRRPLKTSALTSEQKSELEAGVSSGKSSLRVTSVRSP